MLWKDVALSANTTHIETKDDAVPKPNAPLKPVSRRITVLLMRVFVFVVVTISLSQCALFETRNPEEPSGSGTNYLQPTSEVIVLSNLQNAVKERNTENYIRCLADSTQGAKQTFRFEASSEALATFAEQFRQWSLSSERQAFSSMVSKVSASSVSELLFVNGRYEIRVPDSAVYVADYILRMPHSAASIATTASGSVRLTIIPNQFNQWSIVRWIDSKSGSNDTIPSTWSLLKAQFSN